ncbi:siderophore-interacting protein [Micromonospora antibiotica]|uniref:Siderophore-interacting protein n=1 Tax=Micromonospora antibiotica TaxID=2807623 RepID=A0ABS3V6G6_9ACTN|nr:siderophore-interacting protein [Micromonospora antibiotica]MBO4161200.1 siderophore-interacting protein [Micromonospora antibiotica]
MLTPRTVRITLTGESLTTAPPRVAADLEILLPGSDREVKRHYTIRHARPETGEIDLDVLLHEGHGPGAHWAATTRPGETVRFVGPRGKMELRPADWYLLVGDESALPALCVITEALDPGPVSYLLAEIGDEQDRVPVQATHLIWVRRDGSPPGSPHPLAAYLDELDPPAGHGRAYLLGESRAVTALRARLPRLGIAAHDIFIKGYWNAKHDD